MTFAQLVLAAILAGVVASSNPQHASNRLLLQGTASSSLTEAGSATVKPSQAKLTFNFVDPELTPATWSIELGADGQGRYRSQSGAQSTPDPGKGTPEAFDQPILISAPVREQLFATARSRSFFNRVCESRNKVAFTGHKTVAYTGPDGSGSCTFNWSQDEQLMKLVATFNAISTTLEEGRRLHLAYLHDRLSLDAELETLSAEAKAGQAVELGNIAPELEAIASDAAVMKRAQARAAALLAASKGSGPGSR